MQEAQDGLPAQRGRQQQQGDGLRHRGDVLGLAVAVRVVGVRGPGGHGDRVQGQGGHHGVESRVGGLRQHGETAGGEGGGELQGHQGQGGDEGGEGDATYGTPVGGDGGSPVRGRSHSNVMKTWGGTS